MVENAVAEQPAPRSSVSAGGNRVEVCHSDVRKAYADAARPACQPHVVDMIPTRFSTIITLSALALSCAAGLEALYGHVALGQSDFRIAQLPAIHLGAPGSVACWLSAVLLLAAAMYGVLIYLIRRHRQDDYRGRYRMWCWVVIALVVASIDQVADLQGTVRAAALQWAGIPDYADAMLIWTGGVAVVVGALGIWLAVEMRACRLALGAFTLAMACYTLIAIIRLGWLWGDASVFRTMIVSGLTLGGHVAVFTTTCLYARHVHRDASAPGGLEETPPRRRRRAKTAAPAADPAVSPTDASASSTSSLDTKTGKTRRVDGPHDPPSPVQPVSAALRIPGNGERTSQKERLTAPAVAQRPAPTGDAAQRRPSVPQPASQPSPPTAADTRARPLPPTDEDDDGQAGDRRLSKAERKKLRRQQRQERQA